MNNHAVKIDSPIKKDDYLIPYLREEGIDRFFEADGRYIAFASLDIPLND